VGKYYNTGKLNMNRFTKKAELMGIATDFTVADTVAMARTLLSDIKNYKLDVVAKELNISLENHHRAVDDAECTAQIFVKFLAMLKKDGIETLEELNAKGKASVDAVRKLHSYHIIIVPVSDRLRPVGTGGDCRHHFAGV
jgi:DNA polymerase-3 subunit alpha (Gram-positive type)